MPGRHAACLLVDGAYAATPVVLNTPRVASLLGRRTEGVSWGSRSPFRGNGGAGERAGTARSDGGPPGRPADPERARGIRGLSPRDSPGLADPLLPILTRSSSALAGSPGRRPPRRCRRPQPQPGRRPASSASITTSAPLPRPRAAFGSAGARACQSVGAEDLYAAVTDRFATVPAVEVGEVFCLGNCALGPSATIDGRLCRTGHPRTLCWHRDLSRHGVHGLRRGETSSSRGPSRPQRADGCGSPGLGRGRAVGADWWQRRRSRIGESPYAAMDLAECCGSNRSSRSSPSTDRSVMPMSHRPRSPRSSPRASPAVRSGRRCIGLDAPVAHPPAAVKLRQVGVIDRPISPATARSAGMPGSPALSLDPPPWCEITSPACAVVAAPGSPAGIRVGDRAHRRTDVKFVCCQCRRGRQQDLRRPDAHRGPFTPHRRHDDRCPIPSGRPRGYVYLRSSIPPIATLRQAIEVACAHGLLGADILGSGLQFVLGSGRRGYPTSAARADAPDPSGPARRGRAKPPIPPSHGLFSKPTIVIMLTLAAVPMILRRW